MSKRGGNKNQNQLVVPDPIVPDPVVIPKPKVPIKKGSGLISGPEVQIKLKKCACCGEYTIPVGSSHHKCSNCGWIDDEFQNTHPDSLNGPNPITLNQARENYQQTHQKVY